MGLKTIHGFLLQPETMSATWGVIRVREVCLIEMDSPLETVNDVRAALPAYDFGVTAEPTFTLGLSYHPEVSSLILKEAPSVKEHEAGRPFWLVELVYETGQWLNRLLSGEDQGRGNVGRIKRLEAGTGTALAQSVIVYPWDEPPTWSSNTRRVTINIYHDINGDPLRHANGLPILEGVASEIDLEVHNFTWNIEYDQFTYSTDIAPFIGRVNVQACFGAAADHVLLESCTCTENYRTVNLTVPGGQADTGATATHHFVTCNATFVIDRRADSVLGYFREANRRVSMHTLQLVPVVLIGNPVPVNMLVQIPINEKGDVATSPWPLDPFGLGFPYADLADADPLTDFGFIDTLLPEQNDLTAFAAQYELVIP